MDFKFQPEIASENEDEEKITSDYVEKLQPYEFFYSQDNKLMYKLING